MLVECPINVKQSRLAAASFVIGLLRCEKQLTLDGQVDTP
jgi:hypothetical protein